mmetsp:Transcript_12313/g.18239  ORF Transcript_12313/g.18239 Transcript_12313/m.18239 type:complete len:794 (+) Transcript_12313:306-2687(+)
MTWGRRIARSLSKYKWYYPNRDVRAEYEKNLAKTDEEKTRALDFVEVVPPSLDMAWSYFEHITLPRYLVNHKSDKDQFERAQPGRFDVETRLYPVWGTPESELADFGIGVGIYFYMLRVLTVIMLIAGLIHFPMYEYFSSTDYTPPGEDDSFFLKSSAVCAETEWAACPNCTKKDWLMSYPSTLEGFASTSSDGDSEPLTFIKVNDCEIGYMETLPAYIAFIFIVISITLLRKWSRDKEKEIDDAEQTAQDYSVCVMNPPKDARDPEEWREFFVKNFEDCQIACCTIAVDNEELVRALSQRRDYLLQLEMLTPCDIKFNKNDLKEMAEVALPLSLYKWMTAYYNGKQLYKAIVELDKKIEDLSHFSHDCTSVFLSFETEATQQAVLEAFSTRNCSKFCCGKHALPKNLRFRGKHLLNIVEPAEPDSVRWQDLDETRLQKACQLFTTTILTIAVIGFGGYAILVARRQSPWLAAMTVSFLSKASPYAVYYIMEIESHRSEGSKAASQFTKMSLIRWMYTAIITSCIEPFIFTLQEGENYLIYGIYYIFFSELMFIPLYACMDTGNLYRHYYGPRAPSQKMMNLNFQGTAYELSERYTDMTKFLFFTFYYAAIFPSGFLWTAAIFVAKYLFDKYSLLRVWSPAPHMGSQIAIFSRKYFFTAAMTFYILSMSYTFASFPYDNACPTSSQVSEDYIGNHTAYTVDDDSGDVVEINFSISQDDTNYKYCNQRMVAFPALPDWQPVDSKWMTPDQEKAVYLFGITGFFFALIVILKILWRLVISPIVSCFTKPYKVRVP